MSRYSGYGHTLPLGGYIRPPPLCDKGCRFSPSHRVHSEPREPPPEPLRGWPGRPSDPLCSQEGHSGRPPLTPSRPSVRAKRVHLQLRLRVRLVRCGEQPSRKPPPLTRKSAPNPNTPKGCLGVPRRTLWAASEVPRHTPTGHLDGGRARSAALDLRRGASKCHLDLRRGDPSTSVENSRRSSRSPLRILDGPPPTLWPCIY